MNKQERQGINWNNNGLQRGVFVSFVPHAPRLEEHTFLQMTPNQKDLYVTLKQYCVNRLGMFHQVADCPLLERCRKCQLRHHTRLHDLEEDKYDWLKMTAEMFVHIPGTIDTPIKVRAYLNPLETRSTIRFGGPLPEYRPEFGASVRVVMSSVRNRVLTYSAHHMENVLEKGFQLSLNLITQRRLDR
ncbi:uncharacterized protein [Musca autumnalis]|uniref:uncharacterized protein n=1 Tax=Musca autumnalis TaxID=221902 RepID=UPI003CE90EB3